MSSRKRPSSRELATPDNGPGPLARRRSPDEDLNALRRARAQAELLRAELAELPEGAELDARAMVEELLEDLSDRIQAAEDAA